MSHYPEDGEMVASLTQAYTRKDQPHKGIDCALLFNQEVDSTNILVNRALADAYFLNRDFATAAKVYERLLQLGDSTFNTLYSAGMCHAQLKENEYAYEQLRVALFLKQMQHYGCAYRLGVVCVDTQRYEEGLLYLKIAKELMEPDPAVMRAITLSQGEGYYLTPHYPEAVAAWKEHLAYNPTSIATYYNIANAYAYLLKDNEQAQDYYQQFLDLARQEENPNEQLSKMITSSEEMLQYYKSINQKKK
jgi:tetratricopeptide (TPR) repeat protein